MHAIVLLSETRAMIVHVFQYEERKSAVAVVFFFINGICVIMCVFSGHVTIRISFHRLIYKVSKDGWFLNYPWKYFNI